MRNQMWKLKQEKLQEDILKEGSSQAWGEVSRGEVGV